MPSTLLIQGGYTLFHVRDLSSAFRRDQRGSECHSYKQVPWIQKNQCAQVAYFLWYVSLLGLPQWLSVTTEAACNAGARGDAGSILGPGRSLGGRHGNPLQYSILENPMGKGVWQATVHRVPKSQTWLKLLCMHIHISLPRVETMYFVSLYLWHIMLDLWNQYMWKKITDIYSCDFYFYEIFIHIYSCDSKNRANQSC